MKERRPASARSPFLLPSYDLFTRTVSFDLSGRFERDLLYRLDLPIAEKPGDAGLRAFDGAPLEVARVPRILFMTSAREVPAEPATTFTEPTCGPRDRGDLLCAFEAVDVAFDTRARRSMVIPESIRRRQESVLHADLAPQAAQAG